jgi:ATP-dependent DNA helicase Rep
VGITRAKKNLCITMAAKRKLYGESISTTPSRFIEEIPAEHLIRQGFESQTPEEDKQKGNDARASLKAMFN